ncbi:prepilin-type N-terminal cleavage/methylation domain-containing protein [Neobacillus sp. OS1-33]|uniref:prepilin-type N-terminal cleavage/methylation domain-containing protein n=1 Tax=Neobacillus sp. OS1-33 TaxID=3070683 RepID=UPI0027E053D7|nr:prepilin-type N-terminal cleavage/methylation domain-containing protein [Neobacillus sp. OS1-33]WML25421.1 prepilin-type N-terminal cleavage/methylation domain-containing protein [Neobacillus sp. OS1-33]
MKKLVKNEKGFTLLEILLSLSILSIVILVFFGFFIQSAKFSFQSQNKMSAGQLSQEILGKVKSSTFQADLTVDNFKELYKDDTSRYQIDTNGKFYLKINNQNYYPQVKIIPAKGQNGEFSTQLYYIQVEIGVQEKGVWNKKFETYGFKGN